jgi:hypothetical protein
MHVVQTQMFSVASNLLLADHRLDPLHSRLRTDDNAQMGLLKGVLGRIVSISPSFSTTRETQDSSFLISPIVMGVGLGILYGATQFAVLAPIKPSEQPHAVRAPLLSLFAAINHTECSSTQMAFYGFTRAFGQVFGIVIGSTVLQNELTKNLPSEFVAQFGGSSDIAFAAIPVISTLYVSSLTPFSLTALTSCLYTAALNPSARKFARPSQPVFARSGSS